MFPSMFFYSYPPTSLAPSYPSATSDSCQQPLPPSDSPNARDPCYDHTNFWEGFHEQDMDLMLSPFANLIF